MSETYIVGYDGSDAAEAAVRFAERLAQHTQAGVVVAAVHRGAPHVPGTVTRDVPGGSADEARAEAHRLLERLPGEALERRAIASDSAAHGLHDLAEQRAADLLVVGVTHRGPLGRIAGSVADRLLHGATCPVVVVPPAEDGGRVGTIGVAYDDRDESRAALRVATDLALRLRARLVVLGVHEPSLAYGAAGVPATTWELEEGGRQALERAVRRAVEGLPAQLGVEVRVAAGPAGPTLLEAAREGIDLLVCGSRGYGPLRSVLLGSVSRRLADHAPCPVLVVPRGATAPPAAKGAATLPATELT